MGIKEGALALADELEAFEDGDCEECSLYGQPECKGHLSCMEIMARYAARKMREAVERDAEDVTTVSAYDLLSDEDREALAWVREHGGLGAVNKRLMPEGMEWLLEVWPKWSNGEYCKFGDWWTAVKYGYYEPKQLRRLGFFTPEQLKEWEQDEGDNYGYEWNFMRPSNTNYRPDKAETPASEVLAADGEPLEAGQTVWDENGDELVIGALEDGGHTVACRYADVGDGIPVHGMWSPSDLTHQRPVLDADGVLCREGDEVWEVRSHRRREIVGTHYRDYETGEPLILCDGDDAIPIPATCVTHAKPEPPDSWERLDEDAEKNPFDYCKDVGHRLDTCENAERFKSRDIVRRCRALAERGE